jgi:4'-phosphopantetheinyl transferase EntD
MGRVAVSISHDAGFAVAVAFGVRTAGGRYVFPLDIEARLDDRERKILARMERLREQHEATVRERALLEAGAARDGTDGG